MYDIKEVGSKYSSTYKCYITKDGEIISPWHDIPAYSSSNIMCVNEIPRFENGKFEICKEDAYNPIKQDIKKGKPRFVANIFPHKGYPWNYGAIPQTWEDPNSKDVHCDAKGDNDPIDVIEIGSKRKATGEVYEAKVLGCLALLDDGECDWKVIVIDVNDPLCASLNGIESVRCNFPGLLEMTRNWFRDYKTADGKGENKFALNGEFMDRDFTLEIIRNANLSWQKMIKSKKDEEINVKEMKREDDSQIPESLGEYFYVKNK